jgi:septum formation protein
VDPRVVVSGVDESAVAADSVRLLVGELAHAKAASVAAGLEDAVVLGFDSLLELDGRGFGKPGSADEAVAWWRARRGRTGTLHTGHCVIDTGSGAVSRGIAGTEVRFAAPTDEEIVAYVATGEPLQVAGAFTLEGLGAWFIQDVTGDPSNVMGLSFQLLYRLLAEVGVPLGDLWPVQEP